MPVWFVVDNSVVMSWCFPDEKNDYAERVLGSLGTSQALAPGIWPLEVGNGLLLAQRKKRLSEARTVMFLDLLSSLPITVERESPERMLKEILALAREHNLSTYDASYLDLAMRLGLPLATLDAPLSRAVRKCRVKRYEP